jgi:hypothetical protein
MPGCEPACTVISVFTGMSTSTALNDATAGVAVVLLPSPLNVFILQAVNNVMVPMIHTADKGLLYINEILAVLIMLPPHKAYCAHNGKW